MINHFYEIYYDDASTERIRIQAVDKKTAESYLKEYMDFYEKSKHIIKIAKFKTKLIKEPHKWKTINKRAMTKIWENC